MFNVIQWSEIAVFQIATVSILEYCRDDNLIYVNHLASLFRHVSCRLSLKQVQQKLTIVTFIKVGFIAGLLH